MPLIHTVKGFMNACKEGDEALVRKHLRWNGTRGCLDMRDKDSNSALHFLVRGALFGILSEFISGCADVNARNKDGETPLAVAVQYGNAEAVKILLAAGADPNIPDKNGQLPLDAAACLASPAPLKALLDAGARIDTQNKPLVGATEYNRPENALALLEKGAKPDQHRGNYRQPVHYAAQQGQIDVLKALLDKGADINARDCYGNAPLHWAVDNSNIVSIEFLLSRSASTTIENSSGSTPLGRARERNCEQAIRLLEAAEKKAQALPGPVTTPITAPPADTVDGGENWLLLAPGKAAHVGVYPAIGRRITEVFNFAGRERLIITENMRTGAETTTQPEKFENLPEETVRQATEALARLGGGGDAPKKTFNL